MIRANRIYETVLYASDLKAAADFYVQGLGLKLLSASELMLVMAVGENHLLVFDPDKSAAAGRLVPSHGTKGEGHVAFVAKPHELDAWRSRLAGEGIEIESEVQWDGGKRGTSIYLRDPAGNSVELAPPNLWQYLRQNDTNGESKSSEGL